MKSNREFEKNGLIVLILTTFGSGINYLSQILMGRTLGVENYGLLNSVFSWMLITGVIGTTLGMISSKNIASCYAQRERVIGLIARSNRDLWKLCLICTVVFGIGSYVFYPTVDGLLIVLITISLISNLLPLYFQGVLGGLQRFVEMAVVCIITPLCKICIVFLLLLFKSGEENGVHYILSSIIFGGIVVAVFAMLIIYRNGYMRRDGIQNVKAAERETVVLFFVNAMTMVLMNADVLFMERVVGKSEAGLYSATLMFGRILYFGATAIVSVLLPMVAVEAEKGEGREKTLLRKTVGLLLLVAIVVLVPINILSDKILYIFYGSNYVIASKYTIYASLISMGASLNVVMMNYMLGIKKIEVYGKSLFVGLVLIIVFIGLFIKYELIALLVMGILSILIALFNLVYCCKNK